MFEDEDILNSLDEIVMKAIDKLNIPGIAIGIIANGIVLLKKGYGFRDLENKLPVTEDTIFPIGSCTKAFTTYLLSELVEEGRISWNDPVVKHLPDFRLKDDHSTLHATIKDLVSHRTGLDHNDSIWYFNPNISRSEIFYRLKHLNFTYELRENFKYNNIMYVVAGFIIEKITGKSWEENISSRILKPLEMKNSSLFISDIKKSQDFAFPYYEKKDLSGNGSIPFKSFSSIGPAGSINSTVNDMLKWIQFQLSEKQEFHTKIMHSLHASYCNYPNFQESSYNLGYGLGWIVGMHNGHYFVEHGGGVDGFVSSVRLIPDKKIGIVVLTNTSILGTFSCDLSKSIADRIFGIFDDSWIDKLMIKKEKKKNLLLKHEQSTNSNTNLDDYIGEYENPGYGTVCVTKKDGSIILNYYDLYMNIIHKCHDIFDAIPHDPMIFETLTCTFVRNKHGKVSKVLVPLNKYSDTLFLRKDLSSENQ